jgi:hypothetical protein
MTTATANKFFAVVTFGSAPRQTVFTSLDRAKRAAQSAIGRGSCSAARVYECDSRTLAKTADISLVRDGERIV